MNKLLKNHRHSIVFLLPNPRETKNAGLSQNILGRLTCFGFDEKTPSQTGTNRTIAIQTYFLFKRGTKINCLKTKGTTKKFWITQSRVIQIIQMQSTHSNPRFGLLNLKLYCTIKNWITQSEIGLHHSKILDDTIQKSWITQSKVIQINPK